MKKIKEIKQKIQENPTLNYIKTRRPKKYSKIIDENDKNKKILGEKKTKTKIHSKEIDDNDRNKKKLEECSGFLQTANVCIAMIVIKYTKIPALNSEKQDHAKGKIVI